MTIVAIEPKRSSEYIQLIEQLRHSITKAVDIATERYEQGKKDGLSNSIIRGYIEAALKGIVKQRQLRNVLPLELKHTEKIRIR